MDDDNDDYQFRLNDTNNQSIIAADSMRNYFETVARVAMNTLDSRNNCESEQEDETSIQEIVTIHHQSKSIYFFMIIDLDNN